MKLLSIFAVLSTAFSMAMADEVCVSGVELSDPQRDPINPYYNYERLKDYKTVTTFKYFDRGGDHYLRSVSLAGQPRPDLSRMVYLTDILSGQNILPAAWEYCYDTKVPNVQYLRFDRRLETPGFSRTTFNHHLVNYSIVAVNYVPVDGQVESDQDPLDYNSDDNIRTDDPINYNNDENIRTDDPIHYSDEGETPVDCNDPLGYNRGSGRAGCQ